MNQEQLENRIKELEKELQETKEKLSAAENHIGGLQYKMNRLDIDYEPYEEDEE